MTEYSVELDVRLGTFRATGDREFIEHMFDRFVAELQTTSFPSGTNEPDEAQSGEAEQKPEQAREAGQKRPAQRRRKRTSGKTDSSGRKPATATVDKIDPDLDASGLDEFVDPFGDLKNYERMLVFAKFLSDEKGLTPASAQQIYTCFHLRRQKEKIPGAYAQLIRDTQSKHGYIAYEDFDAIHITAVGENYFNHNLTKRVNDT